MFHWLSRILRPKVEITIIIDDDCPRVARRIAVQSLTINNQKTEGIIMASTFKSTQKVAYKLTWLDAQGQETTDAVTGVSASNGDGTIAVAQPTADHEGWILGKGNGTVDIVFKGKNSIGEDVSGLVTITISDGTPPPPPPPTPNPAKSIGITLGDPVDQ